MQKSLVTNIISKGKAISMRFPISLLSAMTIVVSLMSVVNDINIYFVPELKFCIAAGCIFFLYISLQLFAENHKFDNNSYRLAIVILTITLSLIFKTQSNFNLTLLLLGSIATLFVAPYIFHEDDETSYVVFGVYMAKSALLTFIFTIMACFLLSFTITTSEKLFYLQIPTSLHGNIWFVFSSLFASLYFLYSIPEKLSFKEISYHSSIIFMFSYIIVPALVVYLAILHLYSIKALIEWHLADISTAYMVAVFSVVAVFMHIFIYPLKTNAPKLTKFFCKYFYHMLVIPSILLLVDICIRIHHYGFTENRYSALVLSLGLLASCFYFIFKQNVKLRTPVIIISMLAILCSFGPWSASSVSGRSQVSRLSVLLKKNQLLQDGVIQKTHKEINNSDRKNIVSIVRYLQRTNNIHLIKKWFAEDSYINNTLQKDILAFGVLRDMGIKPNTE